MTPRELDHLGIKERKRVERALKNGVELIFVEKPDVHGDEIPLALSLAAINAAIWERENQVRRLIATAKPMHTDHNTIGRIAVEITRLNDWRSALVGEEKVYG